MNEFTHIQLIFSWLSVVKLSVGNCCYVPGDKGSVQRIMVNVNTIIQIGVASVYSLFIALKFRQLSALIGSIGLTQYNSFKN
jgi:hypothetical protein